MNLDFALVNRALQNIGQAPLSAADKEAGNSAWVTAKDYYLTTILESLGEVEWTSAKRRRNLTPTQKPHKGNRDFSRAYDLPIDCAKPIELDGQTYFEVEADLLYTDAQPARLLYVSNGRRLIDQTVLSAGGPNRPRTRDYITGGGPFRANRYEWGDNIVIGLGPQSPQPVPPPEASEDFPDYRQLDLEPAFWLYVENMLAAKYALKISDKAELATLYINKAAAVGRSAAETSIAASAARRPAQKSWIKKLGLS
jgi:hypothetical protein